MLFQNRRIYVDAVFNNGSNTKEIIDFVGEFYDTKDITIETPIVSVGNYTIDLTKRGWVVFYDGGLFFSPEYEFEEYYEPVQDS